MSERGPFSGATEELLDWMEEAERLDLEDQFAAALDAEFDAKAPLLDLPKIIREEPL